MFVYSRHLSEDEFVGRRRALRKVTNRAKTRQNTILVGTPRIGKTSFLFYLESSAARSHWGEAHEKIIFRHLNVQDLLSLQTQAAFWERVLDKAEIHQALGEQADVYERAKDNQFGNFVLELLFEVLEERGYQLIVLLDEFDTFLAHPILNSAEFYGGLRSLSSRFPSLTFILSSRLSIADLNRETQEFAPHGSPYFNTFTEYQLGVLTGRDFELVLRREAFEKPARAFVQDLSGRHPYLTQLTAALLLETKADNFSGEQLYHRAADAIHRQADHFFANCWNGWKTGERKALTAVGLVQLPGLVPGEQANVGELVDQLEQYTPELENLQHTGIVAYDESDGWRIQQELFLWWLADDLRRRLRDKSDFDVWLQQHMLDGAFSQKQKNLLKKAVDEAGSLMTKGASTFIGAYAQGLAQRF